MRTIDADALLKWLSEWELQEAPWWGANGYGDAKVAETIKEAIDAVEQMPTIDAVPVVRCKDCKYYKEGVVLSPQKFCFRLRGRDGEAIGYNFADDDFCSYGERSEE